MPFSAAVCDRTLLRFWTGTTSSLSPKIPTYPSSARLPVSTPVRLAISATAIVPIALVIDPQADPLLSQSDITRPEKRRQVPDAEFQAVLQHVHNYGRHRVRRGGKGLACRQVAEGKLLSFHRPLAQLRGKL